MHNGCYKLRSVHPTQSPTPYRHDITDITPENEQRTIEKHASDVVSMLFPNSRQHSQLTQLFLGAEGVGHPVFRAVCCV